MQLENALKTQEEVGKNISKCRRWFTKVDAFEAHINVCCMCSMGIRQLDNHTGFTLCT